jgi:FkbM family methyltransferase
MNYPLDKSSIFIDVGGHLGNFSYDIHKKYECSIYAFEPLKDNFDKMSKNLSMFPKIICINSALSNFDGETHISSLGASSSLFDRKEGGANTKISVKAFSTFVGEEGLEVIDLVKMNIEGSEYELLDEIIDSGCISKIKHLQIQFHNFVEDAPRKRKEIRTKLKMTHVNKFNYPFIWERWDIKNDI